jgi:hypothetical protein
MSTITALRKILIKKECFIHEQTTKHTETLALDHGRNYPGSLILLPTFMEVVPHRSFLDSISLLLSQRYPSYRTIDSYVVHFLPALYTRCLYHLVLERPKLASNYLTRTPDNTGGNRNGIPGNYCFFYRSFCYH